MTDICSACGYAVYSDEPESYCCGAEVVEGDSLSLPATTHIARKAHWDTFGQRAINPGDRYRRYPVRIWRTGGPSWVTVRKVLLQRGEGVENVP